MHCPSIPLIILQFNHKAHKFQQNLTICGHHPLAIRAPPAIMDFTENGILQLPPL